MTKINGNTPRPVVSSSEPKAAPAASGSTPAVATGWTAKSGASTPAAQPALPAKKEIVCPVLGSLINEGKIKVQADGTIKLEDVSATGKKDLGLSAPLRAALTGIGFISNPPGEILHNTLRNELNVEDLRAGIAKHPGDTAILTDGKFDQQKFDALVSHAENGVMTVDAFSNAIAANVKRDLQPGQTMDTLIRGKNFSIVEFAGLVAVFGKKDAKTGKMGIPVEEMRAMYQDKKLPTVDGATMIETLKLQASMTMKVDGALASSAFKSLSTATGLSEAGARITEAKEGPSAGAQAAVSAGKAANCPHLAKAGNQPNPNAVVNAHLK